MKAYIVLRKPVLMEDEGHQHHIAVYTNREAAERWIKAQEGQYFGPGDYWIAEADFLGDA